MKVSFYAAVLASCLGMFLEAAEPDLPPLPKVDAWRKNAGAG